MRSERAWLRRSAINQTRKLLRTEGGRYVDYSIKLVPVEKDEKSGIEIIPGLPGVWQAAEARTFGGVYDTLQRRWCPERTTDPIVWYCSLPQLEVICHEPSEPYLLIYGAEGAGKTQVLAMGGLLHLLGLVGMARRTLYVGMVAPTGDRLKMARRTIMEKVPIDTPADRRDDSWATYYASEQEIRFHFGVTLECRAAEGHSKAAGSPIQARTWAGALVDEDQDVAELGRDPDIEGRLRGSRRTWRLSTATAKDSPIWRRIRDKRMASGDWTIRRLPYYTNALEWDERWLKMARNISKREKLRRMDAEDVSAELATYYNWDRSRQLQPLPDLGVDVTRAIVRGHGYAAYSREAAGIQGPRPSLCMIAAHDPGLIFQTTILLRCYWLGGLPTWWVIGEYISGPRRDESEGKSVTARQHFRGLKLWLQETYQIQYDFDPKDPEEGYDRVIVLSDPHERGEKAPDEDTILSAQREGFDIFKADEGTIKRRTRQEMMNGLMESSTGDVRFYVAVDETGEQASPAAVESFETLTKDDEGVSENNKKGIHDVTHPAVATSYGIWPFERETVTEVTRELAKREARL